MPLQWSRYTALIFALGLGVGESRGLRRLDTGGAGHAERRCLLAVPAAGLIAAPRGRDRGEREKHRCHGLEQLVHSAGAVAHDCATPSLSQGIGTCRSTASSASSTMTSDRSMATGLSPPAPEWNGLSSA